MFLRKLMALPFLPADHLRNAFDALYAQAADIGGPILKIRDYVLGTWVESQMWRPENWSVFRETVRTNNDVEGWYRRMNSRAERGDLALYDLVPFLRTESETADLQVRLVTENLLTRIHRKRSSEVHGRLFEAWDQYEDDELTTSQLLRTCSKISGLATICSNDRIHDEE